MEQLNQELKNIEEKLIILNKTIMKEEICRDSHWVSSRQRRAEKERDEFFKRKMDLLNQLEKLI